MDQISSHLFFGQMFTETKHSSVLSKQNKKYCDNKIWWTSTGTNPRSRDGAKVQVILSPWEDNGAHWVRNIFEIAFLPLLKVYIFWEGHKNLTKCPSWFVFLFTTQQINWKIFVIFLWPSQKIWALPTLSGDISNLIFYFFTKSR